MGPKGFNVPLRNAPVAEMFHLRVDSQLRGRFDALGEKIHEVSPGRRHNLPALLHVRMQVNFNKERERRRRGGLSKRRASHFAVKASEPA